MSRTLHIIALLALLVSISNSRKRDYNERNISNNNNKNPSSYSEHSTFSNTRTQAQPQYYYRQEALIRKAKANEVLSFMNLEADPCKDFYDYACGNWGEHKKVREEEGFMTVQSQLEQSVHRDLESILELQSDKDSVEDRLKLFYKNCRQERSESEEQKKVFMNFARQHVELTTVPLTNLQSKQQHYYWETVIGRLFGNFNIEILIAIDIEPDRGTPGNRIYFKEPQNTLIPPEYCNAAATSDRNIRDEVYEQIVREVADNMKAWLSLDEDTAARTASEIVRFEFELCRAMRVDETTRSYKGELRYTLSQLTQHFNNRINFTSFLASAFNRTYKEHVYMRSMNYYNNLANAVAKSSRPSLANYIMYRSLSSLALPSNVDMRVRAKFCVDVMLRYYPKIMGIMYRKKHAQSEYRTDIEFLYTYIRPAFKHATVTPWLDDNARTNIETATSSYKIAYSIYQNLELNDLPPENYANYWQKLHHAMKFNAGQMKNRFFNAEINNKSQGIESYEVDVKFQPFERSLIIGLGLLREPFYNYYYARSLKFSMIGQRISRELINAATEQAWSNNAQSPQQWNAYTSENYHNITECFRTQFSNYLYNNPEEFYNSTKVRSLMADVSGLNVAFQSYLAWLEDQDPSNLNILSKETLPDVNFSNTQLFFINFAQTRCMARFDEATPPEYLPLDKHTMERYDVNGPLANCEEFAREFNCAAGTEMNPPDKCVVF